MAFVYGIVRNKVIDAYRAAGRDRSEPMEDLPDHIDDDDRAGPEAAVLRSADRALLHELLDQLPELQREVLGLRVAMGYSAEETARMIGSTARGGAGDPTPGDDEAPGAARRTAGRTGLSRPTSFPLDAAQPPLRRPPLDHAGPRPWG